MALALGLSCLTAPLAAHSELRRSAPADGATLPSAPTVLVMEFNEPARITALRLVDATGRRTSLKPVETGAHRREAPLPPLGEGHHLVEWRAISADGHPIGGRVRFSVDGAGSR